MFSIKSHHKEKNHVEQEDCKKDDTEVKEFEDVEIATTDSFVFASNSKFHGDKTIVEEYTIEQADKWFDNQYTVQVCQTKTSKLVLSIRRNGDFEKSIIAV
tara:strand:+ start:202 stop:504 length:303 start_codon:yes stop_codon:yes gene_type:complete